MRWTDNLQHTTPVDTIAMGVANPLNAGNVKGINIG